MLQITVTSHCFQYKLNKGSFHTSQMLHPKLLNFTQQSKLKVTPVEYLCVL